MYLSLYLIGLVGVLGILISNTKNSFILSAPYVSFFIGGYVLIQTWKSIDIERRRNFIVWCLSVFCITLILELLGVTYGLFGKYSYDRVLGTHIRGVPIAIEIDWILIILGAILVLRDRVKGELPLAIFVGLLASAIDYVLIEPVAISLGLWKWVDMIPVYNYILWFMIAYSSTRLFTQFRFKIKTRLAKDLFLANLLFFIILRVCLKFT